jgi:hypothetical protein
VAGLPPDSITVTLSPADRLLLEEIRDNLVRVQAEIGKAAIAAKSPVKTRRSLADA